MSREIEIVIDPDGTVHMEALHFEGKGCHDALEVYRRALGQLKAGKKKAEFYQQKVTVGQKIRK